MSYNTIVRMANDGDLAARFTACAAQESVPSPDSWVGVNRWALVSTDAQAVADYAYAVGTDTNNLGQYGKREDVVNDAKILSIVQALVTAQAPPVE